MLPQAFITCILHHAHDSLDTARTYQCLKWLYYWKGLQKDVDTQVKQCLKYRQQNLHLQHYTQLHLKVPSAPIHFIVIDLIGKFKPLHQGHHYAFTIIGMLMNYTWCIPLGTRVADIVHTYLVNVYCKFGGSHKILSNNGTEFKEQCV